MTMKAIGTLVAAGMLVFLAYSSFSAAAQGLTEYSAQRSQRATRSSQAQRPRTGSSRRGASAAASGGRADPNVVYGVTGRYLGTDPDPNIRANLLFDELKGY